MSKTLIISDIHNRIDWVEQCIKSESPDLTVFLGDYFDDFDDTEATARKTALFVKKMLNKENVVMLIGNHDVHYFPNSNVAYRSSGYTHAKSNEINQVLTLDDWQRMKFVHRVGQWHLSHAGIHPRVFRDKSKKHAFFFVEDLSSSNDLTEVNDNLWKFLLNNNKSYSYFGIGRRRYGLQPFGGLTWLDWDYEFSCIQDICQIVGHTTGVVPRCKNSKSSNWCLDTYNKHIGFITDGCFSYKDNPYLS